MEPRSHTWQADSLPVKPPGKPQPGIKPLPPAVEAESPNHWTIREFQKKFLALKTREYKPKHRKIPTILLAFGDSRLLFLYINMIFLVNVISLFVTFFFSFNNVISTFLYFKIIFHDTVFLMAEKESILVVYYDTFI